MQPPVGGFLRLHGWGTASDTSRGGVRARVSAPLSVAFSRSIFERRASMGSRQRPRGSSRVRPRATAPRPRVFSPISHPSVLTRSPVPSPPAAVQVLHRHGRQGGLSGEPIHPACSPAAHVGNARIDRRRAFPPERLSRRRAAPASVWRASRRATAPAGSLSFALFRCRFQPSAERWVPRAPRRAARLPWTPRLTLPRKRPIPASQETQPTIGGGYNLLKRIRKVYSHDERPYHAFLAILIRFRNAEFTTEQVRARPQPSRAIPATVPGRPFCFLAREARRDALPPPRASPPRPPSRRVTPRRLAMIPYRRRSQVSPLVIRRADSRIRGSNFPLSPGVFVSKTPLESHIFLAPRPRFGRIWERAESGRHSVGTFPARASSSPSDFPRRLSAPPLSAFHPDSHR